MASRPAPLLRLTLPPHPQYGIVLDAGSSHTSMFIYKWPADKENDTGIVGQHSSCDVRGKGPLSAGRPRLHTRCGASGALPGLSFCRLGPSDPSAWCQGATPGRSCRSPPQGRLCPWVSEWLWTVPRKEAPGNIWKVWALPGPRLALHPR